MPRACCVWPALLMFPLGFALLVPAGASPNSSSASRRCAGDIALDTTYEKPVQ